MRGAASSLMSLAAMLMTQVAGPGAGGPGDGFIPEPQFRGPTPGKRRAGRSAGRYGRGLVNHWNAKRLKERGRPPLHDEHGAFTLVGPETMFVDYAPGPRYFETCCETHPHAGQVIFARRKWLAGVSAQRGY
jgi:hypothetical protein